MRNSIHGLACALLLAFVLSPSVARAEEKTLVYCSEGSPENFNPQINFTLTTFDAVYPIFNRLVEFERGTTKLIPALAESYEISADGLVYTFHLRRNVHFHTTDYFKPSRALNASDVLATFNRMWKKDDPYFKVSGGSYDYFNDMGIATNLASLEAVGEDAVRFTLKKADAPFLANLAIDFAGIQSKEYMDQMLAAGTPENVDQEPIGTGPFVFVAYKKDVSIRYRAHPDYFRGKQQIDNLVFAITPDATVRKAKLLAGECDLMAYPNPQDIAELEGSENVQIFAQPGLNIGMVVFNTLKPPLDDRRVRVAINMAVDRDAIIKAVYHGRAAVAVNPLPPAIWSYDDTIQPYPYDPEKARALLAEAGVGQLQLDIWAMPVQRPYNPDAQKIAVMMQSDLEKVGISTRIVTYEWGEYRKRAQAGEGQLVQIGAIADNGDPDNFLDMLLSCRAAREGGLNYARWCDPAYDELVTRAKTISDQSERAELYRQAQKIFHEEAPWLPVAYAFDQDAANKRVRGYKMHPLGNHIFEGVSLSD